MTYKVFHGNKPSLAVEKPILNPLSKRVIMPALIGNDEALHKQT